jgi:hypothetical protein
MDRVLSAIELDDVKFITLSYLLSYLCFDNDDRDKILTAIKSKSEFLLEKVRFQIELYFDFSVGVLRLAKKERYEVFVDAELVEISEYVKKEKEALMETFSNDEKKYLDIIELLTSRLNQLEKENSELKGNGVIRSLPLKSKRILVVGDTGRKDSYREIVEQYGGNFEFMDGIFEPEKISFMSEKADLAILVIPRMKHSVSNTLKVKKIPTIFVNSAGVSSFEEVVNNYCCG